MKKLLSVLLLVAASPLFANETTGYQKPSKEILALVDVQRAPSSIINSSYDQMLLLYRDNYKSIESLSKEELRLGGLRIDPKTNIGSRATYYNNIELQKVGEKTSIKVKGLPKNPRLTNFSYSPNEKYIAMTNTTDKSLQLWILDIEKAQAKQLSNLKLTANMGNTINWFADSKAVLVKALPKKRQPLIDTKLAVPTGPTISVSDGKKAQNRTYQDLLKNADDEFNFEQLARSTLKKVTLKGKVTDWLDTAMYGDVSFSPDGNYVLVTEYKHPFSYLVPYSRFPKEISVYSKKAKKLKTLTKVPLIEDLPKGFMAVREGKRSFQWRNDKAANLVYVEALDGGDPQKKVNYRDQLFELEAPFNKVAKTLLKTQDRFYTVIWGNDKIAIAYDYWWNTRNTRSYQFNPSDNTAEVKVISDRSYQDRYSDPGSFVTERNAFNRSVLAIKDSHAFLLGDGYTKEGQFPFLDKFSLEDAKTQRLYRSEYTDKLEAFERFDPKNHRLLVSIESKSDYPNKYFRDLNLDKEKQLSQITYTDNPFKSIQNVHKEVINYKRDDGLDLSGTLYLPLDYEKGKKYPMILWAYPREFKNKASAGQTTQNPNSFTYPSYGSPIYWVTKGYVVLHNATFPIVGEGKEEPNDSFRSQLVANGKAAIDAVDKMGYIDRNRVAVGGHSYGAFMVANLLSHSDLFAAGIARSGAYNRTLTPFGFQSEERNYWEAPEVYYNMSPFMHADKMKTPLLLIHGDADNNSGTYPLQSQRYFNALKGLGAPVRLVMLPKESHGYRAKESVLHVIWEQDQWLEKYVKNKSVNQ